MSNHKARTWDHRGSKPLGPKLLPLGHHLDGYHPPIIDCVGVVCARVLSPPSLLHYVRVSMSQNATPSINNGTFFLGNQTLWVAVHEIKISGMNKCWWQLLLTCYFNAPCFYLLPILIEDFHGDLLPFFIIIHQCMFFLLLETEFYIKFQIWP